MYSQFMMHGQKNIKFWHLSVTWGKYLCPTENKGNRVLNWNTQRKTTMNLSICRPCNYSKAYSVHVALNNTTNINKDPFPSSPILNTI